MNEQDQMYTDANTKAIDGVLMQVQTGIKNPCIFVSHALSEQASKWGITAAGVLRLRVLRQTCITRLVRKTIYHEN